MIIFRKYLTLHDPVTQGQPTAEPPAPPSPAPSGITAHDVIDFVLAREQRDAARARQAQVQQQQAPTPLAAPAPVAVAAPQAPAVHDNSAVLQQIAALTDIVKRQDAVIQQERMNAYRVQAIQAVRATGAELVDALVGGSTQAEIDASIQVAVAEYNYLASQWAARMAAQAPPAAPQAPQAQVTNTQQVPVEQPQFSLPGFMAPSGVPMETSSVIPPEQLQYLTSQDAARNGDYARNRNQLHQALRANMKGGPGAFSFNAGTQLAPAMPVGMQAPPAQQQFQQPMATAAGPGNPFAGVQQPQVRTAYEGVPQAHGNPNRGPAQQQYASVQPGRAPQPSQLQHDLGNGNYVPNGQSFNPNAARAAALANVSPAARAAVGA